MIPTSGPISFSQFETELGYAANTTISFGDANTRILFGKSPGQISMSEGRGRGLLWRYGDGLSKSQSEYGEAQIWTSTKGSKALVAGQRGVISTSTDSSTWTYGSGYSTTTANTSTPKVSTAAGSTYVIAGQSPATISVSTDNGTTWNRVLSSFTTQINSLTNYGNTFCGVCDSARIVYSTDNGVNWNTDTSSLNSAWGNVKGVCVGVIGNKFVSFGVGQRLALSNLGYSDWTDGGTALSGTSWGSGTSDTVNDIAYNGSVAVIVGPAGKCATSTDGSTWSYQSGLSAVSGANFTFVKWTGTKFVAISNTGFVCTSTDGVTWTNLGTPLYAYGMNPQSVYVDGSKIVFCCVDGRIAISTDDGVSWTRLENNVNKANTVTGISTSDYPRMASNGTHIIVSSKNNSGQNTKISISGDGGNSWSVIASTDKFSSYNIKFLTWDGSKWIGCHSVGFGTAGQTWFYYSTDAITWTGAGYLSGGSVYCQPTGHIAQGAGKYVISLGASGALGVSVDGYNWFISRLTLDTWTPTIVAYGNNTFVCGTSDGRINTSTDANTWTQQTPALWGTSWYKNPVSDICYANNIFVAVGTGGVCATSTDTVNWTYQPGLRASGWPITANNNLNICYSNNIITIVGSDNADKSYVAHSVDGQSWFTKKLLPDDTGWNNVRFQYHIPGSIITHSNTKIILGAQNSIATLPA